MTGSIPRSPHSSRQGVPAAQVEARWRAQGGRCQLCSATLQSYAADHDHALAQRDGHDPSRGCVRCFRALLCTRCNSLLGLAHDDTSLLRAAVAYLEAWRAQVPL